MTTPNTEHKRVLALFAHRAALTSQVSDAGIMHVLCDDGEDAVLFVGTPDRIVRMAGDLIREVANTTAVWATGSALTDER